MFSQASVILSTWGVGHAWPAGVGGGHMCGRGCVWQGACMAGGGCMHGGVCGQGACIAGEGGMCGVGNAWQEIRPLQRPVRILLECILVQDINFKCKSRMQRCLNLRFFWIGI